MAIRMTSRMRQGGRRVSLGCPCRKPLGQDTSSDSYTGLNPDGSVDTSWIPPQNLPNAITSVDITSNPNPFVLPGYNNGQPVLPSSPASASNPNLYNVPGAPTGTIYNASLNTNVPATGIFGATGLGGASSTGLLIAGGVLLVGLFVISSAKRR